MNLVNVFIMKVLYIAVIFISASSVRGGALNYFEKLKYKDATETYGLYSTNDKINILEKNNFNTQVFNKKNAWLIEFYNSWCGFCKRFAPEWREFASDVNNWENIVAIGAIDCANDNNNDICRDFEILAYPTLKYFHENYTSGPKQIGEILKKGSNAKELREVLVNKLELEQSENRGKNWPVLSAQNYETFADCWVDTPPGVKVVFLIFELDKTSTLGSELILDLESVENIRVRKILPSAKLAISLNIVRFPTLMVVTKDLSSIALTPKDPNRNNLKKAVMTYLDSKKITVPAELLENKIVEDETQSSPLNSSNRETAIELFDYVYQADLETGLRYTLSHEITKMKSISGNSLQALRDYLKVLVKYFPFSANGKIYLTELRDLVLQKNQEWTGEKLAKTIYDLEKTYAPVFSTLSDWIGCKGSAPHLRGFTCSLWTIFHVLTVNAAHKKAADASEVLQAMHGYVKYFFGCTDCSQHFQAMTERNKLNSVVENDGAILWLWVAHNEVNHRLAGDATEDPKYPKKQFPVIENCPKCRHSGGGWDLTEVLIYLKNIYGVHQINMTGAIPHPTQSSSQSSSPLSSLDMVLFGLLYFISAVILVFVLRMFLATRIYKKKLYIHDTLGKV